MKDNKPLRRAERQHTRGALLILGSLYFWNYIIFSDYFNYINVSPHDSGSDCMKQAILDNYSRIKEDVKQIVKDELDRIAADENLKHLIQK